MELVLFFWIVLISYFCDMFNDDLTARGIKTRQQRREDKIISRVLDEHKKKNKGDD